MHDDDHAIVRHGVTRHLLQARALLDEEQAKQAQLQVT
jgi:hypothetical protein